MERIDTKVLKSKILELAMSGKLVPQDSNDEPVELLINRIKQERNKLVKEKKIKKIDDSEIFLGDDNCYYEKNVFPKKWKQVTLQFFSNIFTGNSISDIQKKNYITKTKNSILYISTKDIDMNGNINYSNALHIPEEKFNSFKMTNKNSILMCLEGANAGNKLGIIDENCFFVNKLCSISTFIVNYKYIYYFLRSGIFREQFFSNLQGIIGGVQLTKFKTLSIPLPPIQEQERIVAKIEELFTLVDKIENAQNELDELKKLAKNKILDLAIKGKLVPQDPNDEPASVLLERIKEEKERLIKEGKIKRDKNESYIYQGDDKNYYENVGGSLIKITEQIPFDLPQNWVWVKCKQLIRPVQYGFNGAGKKEGLIKLLRITDIQNGKVNWSTLPYCNIDGKELHIYQIHKDDIFVARTGGTIGKSFRLNEYKENVVFAGYLIRFSFVIPKISEYIELFLNSIFYWNQVADKSSGTGQPNINGVSLSNLLIPLPTLNEQLKIKSKVNVIFDLLSY